jgi:hypothetical protein
MDRLEKSTSNNEDGFIKAVFPFDDEQKGILLNIIQYAVLAIIPIVILLKMIKNYIPEAEDDKGSLVILVEVFGQVIIMFMALYFIHKIIEYIPTYSGFKYGEVNVINIIPALLLISITMQTKLGEKVEILMDRLWELYEGHPPSNNQGKGGQGQGQRQGQGQVRVTQPLSQQYAPTVNAMPSTTTSIDALPNQLQGQQTNMKSQSNEYSIPQSPDFNSMYGGAETPMVGAGNPGGGMESFEPMAANDLLGGGGGFGSSF